MIDPSSLSLRMAVIGAGSIGQHHARVYNELPGARLAAVADLDPATAQEVAGRWAVPAYTDYRQMLEEIRPQAVSVAVPAALHEAVTVDALQAGAHVLVEKPIATELAAAQRMIDCAREAGRLLMVAHIVRFNPAIQALKERLAARFLGDVYQVLCRRVGPFPARANDIGVVVDLATHDLDLMRYLLGSGPQRLFAETLSQVHTPHDDLLSAVLHFPGGVLGALEVNWLTPLKRREVVVLGEGGLLQVDDLTQDFYFYEHAGRGENLWSALQTLRGAQEGAMQRFSIQRVEPLRAELQAFLAAVNGEAPVAVSGEDGLAALRLALALLESARTHQAITLSKE